MSKWRRSKIGGTETEVDVIRLTRWARDDAIALIGIGGYVEPEDLYQHYNVMDAKLFAKIMYATEWMLLEYEGGEAGNSKNIPDTIARHDFESKPHFHQVAEIFRLHLGSEPVRLTDVDE